MGAPKLTKPSDLRSDLYKTLDRVARGEKFIVPTKAGEVMIVSLAEYQVLQDDLRDLKEFERPVKLTDLTDSEDVMSRLAKKYKLKYENQVFKKGRKKGRKKSR